MACTSAPLNRTAAELGQMPQDEPIEGDTDANNDWEDGCRWWISAHQRIAQMTLVDLCAPEDLHSLFLLDVGDSSSLLRDPVPAHLAAPPRRPLRGGVKTERRSGGRARGAAAQAHRDGVHVELVAGMSFFRSPAPSTPSSRPGLRRGGVVGRRRRWP